MISNKLKRKLEKKKSLFPAQNLALMRDFVLETDFFSFLIFFLTCWKSFCYIKYVVSNGSKILI